MGLSIARLLVGNSAHSEDTMNSKTPKRKYKKGYKPGKVNNTVIDKRVHNGIMGAFKRLEAKLARLKVRN